MALLDARSNDFAPIMQMLMAREDRRMQQEMLEMRQQELELKQGEFKLQEQQAISNMSRQAQQDQAGGQTGQMLMQMLMQSDPSIRSAVMQTQPQTMVNAPQVANIAGAAAMGRMPDASQGQRMVNQQPDARMIPGHVAATMAPALQVAQERTANVENARTQTRAAVQAMEHADLMAPIERDAVAAGADASRAAAANSRAEMAERERLRKQMPIERVNQRFEQFQTYLQLSNGDAAWASRLAFGTNEPPTRQALIAEEQTFIQRAELEAGPDPTALSGLYETRELTRIGQALGMSPDDQAWIDQNVERLGGDPIRIFNMAKEASGQENSTISEDDIPTIASYLIARYPNFRLRPQDRSWVSRVIQRARTAPAEPVAARPQTTSRTGGVM